MNEKKPGQRGGEDFDFLAERDSCGVGFIADLRGRCRHDVLEMGLTALGRMRHRGAIAADAETGDGAGVLFQLPSSFFRRELARQGIRLTSGQRIAVGMVFLPADERERTECKRIIEQTIAGCAGSSKETDLGGKSLPFSLPAFGDRGQFCGSGHGPTFRRVALRCLSWRLVPVNLLTLGEEARAGCPLVEQVLVTPAQPCSGDDLERTLFLVRKQIERRLSDAGLSAYIVSFSHRTIVYKALVVSSDVGEFYPDLRSRDVRTPFVIFHGRYSTNTHPSWRLAQPFRFLAHNGEINTIEGNRRWVHARREMIASVWGEEAEWIIPVVDEKESDSASLDNVLELLVHSGRSILHALTMLIPEAYQRLSECDPRLRAFYEYHELLVEPWDGPAAVCFSDGRVVGAALDRNGLRPARYARTEEGLFVLASEAGVLPLDEATIVEKGRLGPGMMIAFDTVTRQLYRDDVIKQRLARRRPYQQWVDRYCIGGRESDLVVRCTQTGREGPPKGELLPDDLLTLQRAFGYCREDVELILNQIILECKEPLGSMGDDTPLPPLSRKPRLVYDYFKQLFAQVTNPPIDPLREQLVMSLETWIGPRSNWLVEEPENCPSPVIRFRSPILTSGHVRWLREQRMLSVAVVPVHFPVSEGVKGFRSAIERVCAEAEAAVDRGAHIVILSDRGVTERRAPVPMLLAVGAVHHHLLRTDKRMRASLVAEVGDARQDHHFACLIGYGANAIYPYLADASALAVARERGLTDPAQVLSTYRAVIEKGLLKIMSKMGISVLASYHGAQLFEAVGLDREVIATCFSGTPSRIGGVGWDELAEEVLGLHRRAFRSEGDRGLPDHGFYRFRQTGEYHAFNPTVIRALHRAVRLEVRHQENEDGARQAYQEAVETRPPVVLRDLLTFRSPRRPIPLADVEPAGEIVRRFCVSAMSHGALSREAHETLAIAMNRLGARSNSGEGGEDPSRFRRPTEGEWTGSAIKQVASARFGVTPGYLVSADELEIKIAQGSKPGEGGQLPAHKVTAEIARLRHCTPGITLISPPPHHDIYSIEDLAELIYDLRQINPDARIAVKLVAEAGVGTIAAGVVKAGADVIHLSGHDGGTGASPLGSIKHAGVPWELGLAEIQRVLRANDLRGRVVLRVDGGLKTGRDVVVAAMLGADEFGFGTPALIALGCVMARQCHLNTCPVGIATQREDLRARFRGKPEYVVAFFLSVAEHVRRLLARLGFRRLEEIIGRSDLLVAQPPVLSACTLPASQQAGTQAGHRLDLSFVIEGSPPAGPRARRFVRRVIGREAVLDETILREVIPAVEREDSIRLAFEITNTHRAVGAKLAGEIARRYGDRGLSGRTIEITFRGTAGQSFGAFCLPGLRFTLIGEANDYVGKGMAGGEIVIRPSESARFVWHENVIVGNTVLYGATGGRLFIAGRAGERFAVRNSGAVAVVEGVGDHGCEYMTGGTVVVLGDVGFNFAAGMTGGIAVVYDEHKKLISRMNGELVSLATLDLDDRVWLRDLLGDYCDATGSPRARRLLDSWEESVAFFVKVVPRTAVVFERTRDEDESRRSPFRGAAGVSRLAVGVRSTL